MSKQNPAVAPWYKQPWLWFILAPLIAVFIYGSFFLYLSIITADGLVKDDYYKVARGFERDNSKTLAAADFGIKASLTVDNLTGDLVLQLSGQPKQWSEQLSIELIHPTHQQYDYTVTLRKIPGSHAYRGSLRSALQGKRYLVITPQDQSWSLRSEIQPPFDQRTFQIDPNGH